MNELTTDVLIVGGGTGGTAAAIQAARQGVKTILVSETPWLGGMLTSAGVSAPDGNELAAWQTGLWGAFLRELQHRQTGGLDHGWVSMFTYDPRIGAKILANWVQELPNLQWISGQIPIDVFKSGECITGVRFNDFTVKAKITLDGTELGDLLALAEVSYRWGWEWRSQFGEPSAPIASNTLTQRYPVQAPTWVVIMQDFGIAGEAPEIPAPTNDYPEQFSGALQGYSIEQFLNYGRLPGGLLMINWPQCGNDYGQDIGRLIQSPSLKQQFLQEARSHSQSFAHFIQTQLGRRYGLANNIFPHHQFGGGAYALHPYYRESRRLVGLVTLREQDILPIPGRQVAPLAVDEYGQVNAIAIGNYPNDHHYPGINFPLAPKSIRWGGRWTGTPFTIPYGSLIPRSTDGLLVCEKNISVSHIANGSTRLQPVVMNLGQAAGMAAALCIMDNCQPRNLSVKRIQSALLQDPIAPAPIIPLFNIPPNHPDWLSWQYYYLNQPEDYLKTPDNINFPSNLVIKTDAPTEGSQDVEKMDVLTINATSDQENISTHRPLPSHPLTLSSFTGIFTHHAEQNYSITLTQPTIHAGQTWILITLQPEINQQLQTCHDQQLITVWGRLNHSGNWLVVARID